MGAANTGEILDAVTAESRFKLQDQRWIELNDFPENIERALQRMHTLTVTSRSTRL